MRVSTEIEPPLKSSRSSKTKFLVQIQIGPIFFVEFVPRDTRIWVWLLLLDLGGGSISVETIIRLSGKNLAMIGHSERKCRSLAEPPEAQRRRRFFFGRVLARRRASSREFSAIFYIFLCPPKWCFYRTHVWHIYICILSQLDERLRWPQYLPKKTPFSFRMF